MSSTMAKITNEIDKTKKTPEILGASLTSINKFNLIKEESLRTILIYKKNNKTDNKYPRKYDAIIKKPLK